MATSWGTADRLAFLYGTTLNQDNHYDPPQ
jgi:hypothetical protein